MANLLNGNRKFTEITIVCCHMFGTTSFPISFLHAYLHRLIKSHICFPFSRKEKHHQIEQLSKHLRYLEIDTANSKSNLKIKEASHINCKIPTKFSSHPFNTASVAPCFFLSFFFCFVFAFLFHLLFSLSLTLIICIFYCLYYPSLLLDLITTDLVSHLSLSSIVFIISKLIINIFYCLDYTSLLLHLFTTQSVIDFIITM